MRKLEIFKKLDVAMIEYSENMAKGKGNNEDNTFAIVSKNKNDVIFELLEIIQKEAYKVAKQTYDFHDAIEGIKEVLNAKVDTLGNEQVIY